LVFARSKNTTFGADLGFATTATPLFLAMALVVKALAMPRTFVGANFCLAGLASKAFVALACRFSSGVASTHTVRSFTGGIAQTGFAVWT